MIGNIVPLLVDATTEYLLEQATSILDRVDGPAESETFARHVQFYVLLNCHKLLLEQSVAEKLVTSFNLTFIQRWASRSLRDIF